MTAPATPAPTIRRTRERRKYTRIGDDRRKTIQDRIERFYRDDMADRTRERNARLERYAKYRGWTEGKTWPFENSSDISLPDLMTGSQREQDTLANAMLSAPPETAIRRR